MRPAIFAAKKLVPLNAIGAEIGVGYGKHAQSILTNWPEVKLHLIDDLSESRDYILTALRVLQPFEKRITWHLKSSVLASSSIDNLSLDFIYIDGDHSYTGVKDDIRVWLPKVKRNGVLGGHDYTNLSVPGVKQAVDEFTKTAKFKLYRNQLDWWVSKT